MSGPGRGPVGPGADEPTSRRIALEIAIYAALVLVVGAVFVLVRVERQGPGVLSFDPHAAAREERSTSK